MDEATMERAKAAMIGEDEAKEIGRNALHGARVLIDRANATGIEDRRDEYQEHAADLMVTADLARTVLVLYADLARLRAEHAAALATARREGAGARRIPLKIYLVEGNVIAARSACEAATIADDQCGDAGPVVGPLKGDRTVLMRTTTGEAVQIEVAKLLASGVQRGVVTRALALDAPGGAT